MTTNPTLADHGVRSYNDDPHALQFSMLRVPTVPASHLGLASYADAMVDPSMLLTDPMFTRTSVFTVPVRWNAPLRNRCDDMFVTTDLTGTCAACMGLRPSHADATVVQHEGVLVDCGECGAPDAIEAWFATDAAGNVVTVSASYGGVVDANLAGSLWAMCTKCLGE